jgi:hypothetical protein
MAEVYGTGPWRVVVIESERGWGQKVDMYRRFATEEEALAYQRDFNKTNPPGLAPDWYMQAEDPTYTP